MCDQERKTAHGRQVQAAARIAAGRVALRALQHLALELFLQAPSDRLLRIQPPRLAGPAPVPELQRWKDFQRRLIASIDNGIAPVDLDLLRCR